MSQIRLRDYQKASVDSMIEFWAGGGEHGLIVLPTGAGKSLVASELLYRLWRDHGARPLVLTHVSELVSQNARKLVEAYPDAPCGIYHAGLRRRDSDAPICFAGIHSVFRQPEILGERHVVLIDEAHLLSHKDEGMYRGFLNNLAGRVPGMRVGGLTATPYRLSTGRLDQDYGKHEALFSKIVYEEPITRLIERGYLLPIIPYASPERLDVSGVRSSAGDYNKRQLQEAVDREDINERIVREVVEVGRDRCTWLTFASGVEHAHHLTALFRKAGIATECVTEETSERERQRIYDGARQQSIRCLVGMNTMTTGLDIPSVDLIACVRPTKSVGLWTQMLGRGTRLSPETGKKNCLLLDFSDNSLNLGPIDEISGSKAAPGAKGEAPRRDCPSCHFVHHISLKACPQCGHDYPAGEIKYFAQSRAVSVLSTYKQPTFFDVDQINFRRHVSFGKPDSLRIDYLCGMKTFSHWLALDNPKGKQLAQRWWKNNSRSGVPPETVDEALTRTDDLRVPGRVLVSKDGKREFISSWDYSVAALPPIVETAL